MGLDYPSGILPNSEFSDVQESLPDQSEINLGYSDELITVYKEEHDLSEMFPIDSNICSESCVDPLACSEQKSFPSLNEIVSLHPTGNLLPKCEDSRSAVDSLKLEDSLLPGVSLLRRGDSSSAIETQAITEQVLYPKFSTVKHIKCYNKVKGSSEKVYSCSSCDQKMIPLSEVFRHVNKECSVNSASTSVIEANKSDIFRCVNSQTSTSSKGASNSDLITRVYKEWSDNKTATSSIGVSKSDQKAAEAPRQNVHTLPTNVIGKPVGTMSRIVISEDEKQLMTYQNTKKPHPCKKCNKRFAQKTSLQAHMVHHSFGGANCNYCGVMVKNNMLLAHMKLHSKAHPYQCLECDKGFIFETSLKEHVEREHSLPDGNLKCKVCERCFLSESSLNLHQARVHKNKAMEDSSLCPICGKFFKSKSNLDFHERTVHRNEHKYIICPICGKRFTVRSSFHYHMSVHEDKDTCVCEVCGQGFRNENTLLGHMQCHSNVRPFACRLCESTFKHKRNLHTHMRYSHGAVSRNEDTFPCNTCNKSFFSEAFRKEHMRTHTNERPYHCRLCGLTFCHYQGLYHHKKKTHSQISLKKRDKIGKTRAMITSKRMP